MAYASEDGAAHGRDGAGLWPVALRGALAPALLRAETLPAARQGLAPCPELDCVRGQLAPSLVAFAERRAQALGVGADAVLVAAGALTQEAYAVALAKWLGVPFEPLDRVRRSDCPAADDTLIEAARTGLLVLKTGAAYALVVAPQGLAARFLVLQVAAHPQLRAQVRVTSAARLSAFVRRACGDALAGRAVAALHAAHPALSAAPRPPRMVAPWMAWLAAYLACGLALPAATAVGSELALTVAFLAWAALRLVALPQRPQPAFAPRRQPLPAYTVVVALWQEATQVPALVRALAALDYPREQLDVKFVLEHDDPATRAALDAERGQLAFELIEAPPLGPRTKPKALNAALPFARGEFLAVYDAEDRPEPDQLRRALATFDAGPAELACVQARLTIDNTDDGWLAGLFTAEYAGLFDVLLPALAAYALPIPLGGSSNHFRTAVLREAGGWDPFNVTEDADLGTRLARLGWRVRIIASTTYEEAPARCRPWLKQRTRWFKGWLQTWGVHMRAPLQLARALGPAGFATFQLMLVGTVFTALVQPVALPLLAATLAFGWWPFPGASGAALGWLHATALGSGYVVSLLLGACGLARRGLLTPRRAALLPLWMVGHWALLSAAAWRALYQYLRDPYRWEKTEHGLARTSRLARRPAAHGLEIASPHEPSSS